MQRAEMKLAAYLEEAGEDPAVGCQNLAANNIRYVVLKHVWNGNICDISDTGHQKLHKLLEDNDLTVIAIASEIGRVEATQVNRISAPTFQKAFDVAQYYKAPYVRFYAGTKTRDDAVSSVKDWMQKISEESLKRNIVPLLEITSDSHHYQASQAATLLAGFKRWRLLYDPVQFILKQNQDPFTRYWTLLKGFAAAIDIRDYKIGRGFKPCGYGDSKIALTITNTIAERYDGWYFLEPTLGRKYGQALTRQDTFNLALEALDAVLA